MSASPVNCSHCGFLFMRRDLSLDAPRVCNCCENKEKMRNKTKGESDMEPKNKIQIECDQATHAKLEEVCINLGMSFSEYFLDLHHKRMACVNHPEAMPRVTVSKNELLEQYPEKEETEEELEEKPKSQKKTKGGKK